MVTLDPSTDPPAGVGELLRAWRRVRRTSQWTLALDAGISARHVSFVETGRSRPSRDMVLNLARALDVPLRERNDLLLAAGYAPLYREADLSADEMAVVRRAVESLLARQEPFPAVVLDRQWNVRQGNRGAARFFGRLLDGSGSGEGVEGDAPPNLIRLMFDPVGLRPFVLDWETVARSLLARVHREAVGGVLDPPTRELLDEVLGYPGVPRDWADPPVDRLSLPVVPVGFAHEGRRYRFFSAVTTLGTPQDVTSQEMRIESFFPVDGETEENLSRLQGQAGGPTE